MYGEKGEEPTGSGYRHEARDLIELLTNTDQTLTENMSRPLKLDFDVTTSRSATDRTQILR